MKKLEGLKPERVFHYFEEICAIPRGSGNMERISRYCMEFARKHELKALRDEANNVIVFKKGTLGYEDSEPVILQGHLDMVCQKEEGCMIDFENDGLELSVEGDFITAVGTTLGADNGIAIAMILAILESDSVSHPPLEAVFTTDEEIGMIGASKLSFDALRGKRMINLDSEDAGVLTVSCAGGSDFQMRIPLVQTQCEGTSVTLTVKGLKGGHSGVEINNGSINANVLMARILHHARQIEDFSLVSLSGGDKANAIPARSVARLLVDEPETFAAGLEAYINLVREEIAERESGLEVTIEIGQRGKFSVLDRTLQKQLIFLLLCAPGGVVQMSAEIENLVETSLNLGVLQTGSKEILVHFALRSNKQSALAFLEERMKVFSACIPCEVKTFGHYPPWEFIANSRLQEIYKTAFQQAFGYEPSVEAIHAGLECGVFASGIEELDCISIGPDMSGVHTPSERLSISSTEKIFDVILAVLKDCK